MKTILTVLGLPRGSKPPTASLPYGLRWETWDEVWNYRRGSPNVKNHQNHGGCLGFHISLFLGVNTRVAWVAEWCRGCRSQKTWENHLSVSQYLQGTDSRSPRDTEIQGCSSPLYKTVSYSRPSAIKESASVQVQELQMRTAEIFQAREQRRGAWDQWVWGIPALSPLVLSWPSLLLF